MPEFESENNNQSELTYAKKVLNQGSNEPKILGLGWNKRNDTLSVVTPTFKKNHQLNKRNILSELASVYDPTGLISPANLIGEILYREICESRISWDESVPQTIKLKWEKWKIDIVNKVEIPRSLTLKLEPITSVDLQIFRDASILGYCAVAYAVVSQPSKVNQGLVASKSRLSKKDITIPRLELIAAHMAANLATNIKAALKDLNIRSVIGRTDSTVVLHWLRDHGSYKVFVENRVKKIFEFIEWKYVPTKQNPAGIGSRGSPISKLGDLWWKDPTWLSNISLWPRQPTIGPTTESQVECKAIKEIMTTTIEKSDIFNNLLEKHELYKFLRITAWIVRFLNNCQKTKRSGPYKTDKTEHQNKFWIKREQHRVKDTETFKISKEILDLQKNVEGIYVCRG